MNREWKNTLITTDSTAIPIILTQLPHCLLPSLSFFFFFLFLLRLLFFGVCTHIPYLMPSNFLSRVYLFLLFVFVFCLFQDRTTRAV
jgi:hypothetical protein